MFCINIHFNLILISFAWFKVIRAQIMCIIVGFQKLIIHERDVDAVGWQKGGRIWPQKNWNKIWSSAVL